jgi:hypothetical protein
VNFGVLAPHRIFMIKGLQCAMHISLALPVSLDFI